MRPGFTDASQFTAYLRAVAVPVTRLLSAAMWSGSVRLPAEALVFSARPG